jgi:anti-sigma B factor antagonist
MFSMNLGSGESRGYVVVRPRGELDLASAPAVAAALGLVAAREPRIIVDLAGLEFIDASGVAALSRGRRHARNAGGDLLLAAPQRQVRRVLAIIWEADGFAVHASVAEAAASAGASWQALVPIPRQPTETRWRRMVINAPAPKRRGITGDWLLRSSRGPRYRLPTVGWISG